TLRQIGKGLASSAQPRWETARYLYHLVDFTGFAADQLLAPWHPEVTARIVHAVGRIELQGNAPLFDEVLTQSRTSASTQLIPSDNSRAIIGMIRQLDVQPPRNLTFNEAIEIESKRCELDASKTLQSIAAPSIGAANSKCRELAEK